MTFLDHLEDLRWHILRAIFGVFACTIITFICKDFIVEIIMAPKKMTFPTYRILCKIASYFNANISFCSKKLPFVIEVRKVGGQFSAHIWTSIYSGFVIAFPYVLYQIWSFVSPGLKARERKHSKLFIFSATLLFVSGVLFGYYIIAPLSLNFLTNYTFSEDISNAFDLSSYNAIIRSSCLACGFVFELPIVVYFLTKTGLITPEILKKQRKVAIVLVLILSAIITPPDVTSQIIVAIPILILYQISIYISKVIKRNDADN